MKKRSPHLSAIPSVDEILKSPDGQRWMEAYPRKRVLRATREVLEEKRNAILAGDTPDISAGAISAHVAGRIEVLSSYKLRPLINATGIVIHTNLGRAVLSEFALENIRKTAGSYSNLEYELSSGKRGKRYSHLTDILVELSGGEDAITVNNNAAAVLLCLNTFALGREVVVSRGELVEIGGSFRIPEVMKSGGALLREVGTTNKTRLEDYKNAISGNTGLLLKVHSSNYQVVGFVEEVSLGELTRLGKEYQIPVMADLGSGSMIDLSQFGITGEPTVQSALKTGADIVTFSGDKLLGGPQAGIVVGRKKLIGQLQNNPLLRALRMDKVTMAALEATLTQYLNDDAAVKDVPVLRMLTQPAEVIKRRAQRIASSLRKHISSCADITIIPDQSRAGGGSLPGTDLPTYAVSVRPWHISVNLLQERLRNGNPPVIARIREDALLIDARTVMDREVKSLGHCVISACIKEPVTEESRS